MNRLKTLGAAVRQCGTGGGGAPVYLGFYDAEELGEVVGSGVVSVFAVMVVV
jgi:hypothetical protein